MSFKNKHIVFATGSLKGIAIHDEEINIDTYCYVKMQEKNQVKYLRISNGSYEFTDLPNATSFSQEEATKYVNYFRMHGIKAYLFPCAKKSF